MTIEPDLHRIVAEQQDRLARLEARLEALANPPTFEDVVRQIWVAMGEAWLTAKEITLHATREAPALHVMLLQADCATPAKLAQRLAASRARPMGDFDVHRAGREVGGHRWRIVRCKVGTLT